LIYETNCLQFLFVLIAGLLLGFCLFSFLFSSIVADTYARLFNMQSKFWTIVIGVGTFIVGTNLIFYGEKELKGSVKTLCPLGY